MPETLLALAKAFNTSGNSGAAEKCLLSLLKIEENSALAESAHFQLAQIYSKLGRTVDAQRETALFKQLQSRRK